jgi:hypothetical protein
MKAQYNIKVNEPPEAAPAPNGRRWKRAVRRAALAVCVIILCGAFLLQDHICTLQSLRRVPGTNAYVMDYYVDYNIEQIRAKGMDVDNVANTLIDVFFPDLLVPVAAWAKGKYLVEEIKAVKTAVERCSTIAVRTPKGRMFFGRNFDWLHDACLILRIHDDRGVASIAVLDIHYLNLNRDDLDATNLIERFPLLFAPYYLQDGMNRYGVAVADMSVGGVEAPFDAAKPNLAHATAMRLILDYAKTTDEAIDLIKQYNIHFIDTTCHLMIADAAGKSAVLEFFDGELKVTPTYESWQVCTNHRIAGSDELANDQCCPRYCLASDQLARLNAEAGADDVMNIMASVSKENWTMWTSTYDLSNRELRLAHRRRYDAPFVGRLELLE